MDRPVHFLLALLAAVAVPTLIIAAESVSQTKRERAVSPRMAGRLAAVMPKYEAAPIEIAATLSEPVVEIKPSNTIVRLPSYIVREPKVPLAEEVMTRAAKERFAMQKYLGDEDGLERVLNMFSVAGLWAKIPVLGKYPFVVGQYTSRSSGLAEGPRTNEQRALAMYEQEKMAERWRQLSGLLSPQLKPDSPR